MNCPTQNAEKVAAVLPVKFNQKGIMMEGKVFVLKLDNIINDKNELCSTRLLARLVQERTYVPMKEFLAELSQEDITTILNLSQSITLDGKMNWPKVKLAYTFALVMIMADGDAPLLDLDNCDALVYRAWAFIAMESLNRKGIVEFHANKASFSEDLNLDDVCVVRPEFKDKFNQYVFGHNASSQNTNSPPSQE